MQTTNRKYDEYLTSSYESVGRGHPPMENAFATYTGADISLAYEPAEQSVLNRLKHQQLRASAYWRSHPGQVTGLLMLSAFALGAVIGRLAAQPRRR